LKIQAQILTARSVILLREWETAYTNLKAKRRNKYYDTHTITP